MVPKESKIGLNGLGLLPRFINLWILLWSVDGVVREI